MKEEIRQDISYVLQKAIDILNVKQAKDVEELKELSDHAIEDVVLHKDLDVISITVLIYSLYKIVQNLQEKEYRTILNELKNADRALQKQDLKQYNRSIKIIYSVIRKCDAQVKEHLQDVMQAARIKKGTALLEKGLSIGQAAGLMGLSNWDLQQYAARTTALRFEAETIPAKERMKLALTIFGVKTK